VFVFGALAKPPALVLPLLACLLVLSAWPAAVSDRTFPSDGVQQTIGELPE